MFKYFGIMAILFGGASSVACESNRSEIMKLTWEWAGDRSPDETIIIEITDIEAISKGLFGVSESPSIAANLPDPVKLSGDIVGQDRAGETITLILPSVELPEDLRIGETLELTLLESTICVAVRRAAISD